MGGICGVWFGIDGVIVDHRGAVAEALAGEWVGAFGLFGAGRRVRLRAIERAILASGWRCGCDVKLREISRAFLVETDDEVSESFVQNFGQQYLRALAVFGDVPQLLFHLGGQMKLGVVANGDAAIEREKLMRVGLADRFIVGSFRKGDLSRRSSSSPIELFLKESAMQPHEILFVGSDREGDIEDARRYGLRAVWLNRGSYQRAHDVPTVHSLEDLLWFLEDGAGGVERLR